MTELQMQKGKNLFLKNFGEIRHPTLNEISEIEGDAEIGLEEAEQGYHQLLSCLTLNQKDMADILWFKNKIWYEDFKSEWSFFINKCLGGMTIEKIICEQEDGSQIETEGIIIDKIVEKALNFFLFKNYKYTIIEKNMPDSEEKQIIISSLEENNVFKSDNFKITEFHFMQIIEFLKKINFMKNEYNFEKAHNKITKITMLAFKNKERESASKKKDIIGLDTIVSSIRGKNNYSEKELWSLPIYVLYDLFYRDIKIEEYKNTLSALYAGAIDSKKNPVNWERVNWAGVLKF